MHNVWEGCANGKFASLRFFAQKNRKRIAKFLASYSLWCGELISNMFWRGKFLRLWRSSAGSALIEYSFLISIVIALIVIAVAAAGVWASDVWTRLLPTLSP